LQVGGEVGLGFTHEEPITKIMKNFVSSYKDLPFYPYQIQTKFRNEVRAKSGIMRGREFLMNDMYSFSKDEDEHKVFYEKCIETYHKIFQRLGIGDSTFLTFASGGSFAKYSHEFQTICEVGEDIVYLDRAKKIAVNEEVYNEEVLADLNLDKSNLEKIKVAETGNIFTLGTKFSESLDLKYKNQEGGEEFVFMGSYGIGPSRIMGVLVENFADEKGIVWPESVAPFKVHLINIGEEEKTEELYQQLKEKGVEVL
jgi:prolyl-tRNA synthetase